MSTYFPEQFAHLQKAYTAAMHRLRKTAMTAVAYESGARMEKTYTAVIATLTNSSFGDMGEQERRYRAFLSDQLEDICFRWSESGGRIYDLENDHAHVPSYCEEPFEDLLSSDAYREPCYIHLGEIVLSSAKLQQKAHICGFFIHSSELQGEQGAMLEQRSDGQLASNSCRSTAIELSMIQNFKEC